MKVWTMKQLHCHSEGYSRRIDGPSRRPEAIAEGPLS